MAVNLSPIGNDAPFVDASGNPLNGGLIYTYTATSSTPENTYTTNLGNVANANPIELNSNGYPASGGNVVSIWLTAGVSYLFVLKTSAGVTVWSRDNIEGINDTSVSIDQWVSGPTPTFVSSTSFTLAGDQTSTFHVGRRVKTTNTGGTIYSTITSSAFAALTTIGLENDSGSLDSGLSAVSYSLLSKTNDALPLNVHDFNATTMGSDGTALFARAAATNNLEWVSDFRRKNILHNGDFKVAQRGTSFTAATTPANSDDTYLLDGAILLSDGNDIVDVTQETTTIPTGGFAAIALDVETANKKFGLLFPVEKKNCNYVLGGTVSVSFKARKGAGNATVSTLRAALLAWSSTADAITSDVVSAWNISGTRPTLVANWTAENTDSDLTLTTSYQTFKVENISVDTASAANIALFIYYNNADGTVGDFVYITDVQIEPGTFATSYDYRDFGTTLQMCERYYEKSYDQGVNPGTVAGSALNGQIIYVDPTNGGNMFVSYRTTKRTTPTVTFYSPTSGASGKYRDTTSGADFDATATNGGHNGVQVALAGHGAADETLAIHFTASAEL